MSFQTDPKKILGYWINENISPYFINDKKEITLNIKDENSLSMITLKQGTSIENYVLKFSKFEFNGIDNLKIYLTLENGDNIDFSKIGSEVIIICVGYFGSGNIADQMICECDLFNKRIFKKLDDN